MHHKLDSLLPSPLVFSGLVILSSLHCCKPIAEAADSQSTVRSTGKAATSGVAPAKKSKEKTIKIGFFGSLTGSTAVFGIASRKGIQLAFDEINAKGAPLGQKLELIVEDDASQIDQVPDVVSRLINQDHILALLGEVASSRSLVAAPIAQQAGVPMVSPASTNPAVTKVGNYIFRTCFIDPLQGTVMAKFARINLKAKKAAVLTDEANEYSKSLSKTFTAKWKKLGGQIVATQSYEEGDENFQVQLATIKAATPDVIYVPGYYTEVGPIAVQARRLGLKQPLLGGDGWDSPLLFEIGGKAILGGYFVNHYSSHNKDPRVVRFVREYKKKFGTMPDPLSATAYDAAYILSDAIKRAGAADRAKLRDALASTKNFHGVTGMLTMGKDRNPVKSAVILKVIGKDPSYVTTVSP